MKSRRALLASGLLLLLAGCRAQAWRDYHYTDPVEYYFSYPTTTDLGGAPPLFIALLGDGGEFALEYGLKYPGSVSGISAMSVDSYPETFGATGAMPVQILVGGSDTDRLAAAQGTEAGWWGRGVIE